jgi:hypothetical protein
MEARANLAKWATRHGELRGDGGLPTNHTNAHEGSPFTMRSHSSHGELRGDGGLPTNYTNAHEGSQFTMRSHSRPG